MAYLIQMLLPLHDNAHKTLPVALHAQVKQELMKQFGGITAYMRSPADGLWQNGDDAELSDEMIMYEVMTPVVDAAWWGDYRRQLEERFEQDEVMIRMMAIQRL